MRRVLLIALLALVACGGGKELDPSKARAADKPYVASDAKRLVVQAGDLPKAESLLYNKPLKRDELQIAKLSTLTMLGGHMTKAAIGEGPPMVSVGTVWKDFATASNAMVVLKESYRTEGPLKTKTREAVGPLLGDDRFTFEITGEAPGFVVAWRRNNAIMVILATRAGGITQQELLGYIGAVDVRARKD